MSTDYEFTVSNKCTGCGERVSATGPTKHQAEYRLEEKAEKHRWSHKWSPTQETNLYEVKATYRCPHCGKPLSVKRAFSKMEADHKLDDAYDQHCRKNHGVASVAEPSGGGWGNS